MANKNRTNTQHAPITLDETSTDVIITWNDDDTNAYNNIMGSDTPVYISLMDNKNLMKDVKAVCSWFDDKTAHDMVIGTAVRNAEKERDTIDNSLTSAKNQRYDYMDKLDKLAELLKKAESTESEKALITPIKNTIDTFKRYVKEYDTVIESLEKKFDSACDAVRKLKAMKFERPFPIKKDELGDMKALGDAYDSFCFKYGLSYTDSRIKYEYMRYFSERKAGVYDKKTGLRYKTVLVNNKMFLYATIAILDEHGMISGSIDAISRELNKKI